MKRVFALLAVFGIVVATSLPALAGPPIPHHPIKHRSHGVVPPAPAPIIHHVP
jgi:hypothetical protein